MTEPTIPSQRFELALIYASHVHGGQTRKGTRVPYIAHLLAVAATVLEYGGDEHMAIAALLHDAAEDQGGAPRLRDLEGRFGARVWDRFQASAERTLWLYDELVVLFRARLPGQLADELAEIVAVLRAGTAH